MWDIQNSGGKEGENEYFAVPQHIRIDRSRYAYLSAQRAYASRAQRKNHQKLKAPIRS